MKEYTNPEITVVMFATEDILGPGSTSGYGTEDI